MIQYSDLKQYKTENIIPSYMIPSDTTAQHWQGIPVELLLSKQYQRLKPRTAKFLICLYSRLKDGQQMRCLHGALCDYNALFNMGMTDDDISREAYKQKGKMNAGLFTATRKQMQEFGYDKNATSECLKQLKQAGFIQPIWNEKGARSAWDRNQTVYQFSDKWRNM